MKNTMRCLGVIALAAVIGFSFAALSLTGCDDGGGGKKGGSSQSATYTSYDSEGNSYTLQITKGTNNPGDEDASWSRAAYSPKKGDPYTLTIKSAKGSTIGKSTGYVATVTVNGSVYTISLYHNESTNTVSVSVTGNGISYFSGDIYLDNDETYDNPGNLTTKKPGGNTPGSKTGTWPPNSILSEFGLSGLSAPSGATEMWYAIIVEEDESLLHIHFDGSPAHDSAVTGYFTSNGWTETVVNTGSDTYMAMYDKGDFSGAYMRITDTSCTIQIESSTGGGGSDNWPGAALLTEFGLSGFSRPSGAEDVKHTRGWHTDSESLAITFEVPSGSDSIPGYFTSHGWSQLVNTSGSYMFTKAGFTVMYIRLPPDDGYSHCQITSMKD